MRTRPARRNPAASQEGPRRWRVLVRVTAGVYILFMGLSRIGWVLDSTPLLHQLAEWSSHSTSLDHWISSGSCPGAPVFARLVPLGEIVGGLALVAGIWTRLSAAMLLLMALNFQIAAGAMFHYAYLTNAGGLPLLGSLLALVIGGARLPFRLRR